MPPDSTDRDWEWYGAKDPYYGVLSDPKFHAAGLNGELRQEFFASGEEYVESLSDLVERFTGSGLRPQRALDFGCGVGRVLIPLARRAGEAVGVDVSRSMLAEARRNCEDAGVRNVHFARSDDSLGELPGTFDFIHSFIVFQHIPVSRGEALTRSLLRLLRDGGVGALHYTYHVRKTRALRAYLWAKARIPAIQPVVNAVRGRPVATGAIQMNEYSLSRLMLILHEAGCHEIHSRATLHGGDGANPSRGVMLVFRKRALPLL
jgi:SAM-dependent methyltransferase